MIKNSDGSEYKLLGSVATFDPNVIGPFQDLFNLWDQEAIQRGGSPVYYYECLIQTQTIDPQYLEDRGKLWSPTPIQLWAAYEPVRSQNVLTVHGVDSQNEIKLYLNHKATIDTIGHPPIVGSRIFTPHLRENWKIVQINIAEFMMWGILRYEIYCHQFQESLTTGEGKVTNNVPTKYKIN